MDEFERRKKLIEELVKDELYVPMKIKELATETRACESP